MSKREQFRIRFEKLRSPAQAGTIVRGQFFPPGKFLPEEAGQASSQSNPVTPPESPSGFMNQPEPSPLMKRRQRATKALRLLLGVKGGGNSQQPKLSREEIPLRFSDSEEGLIDQIHSDIRKPENYHSVEYGRPTDHYWVGGDKFHHGVLADYLRETGRESLADVIGEHVANRGLGFAPISRFSNIAGYEGWHAEPTGQIHLHLTHSGLRGVLDYGVMVHSNPRILADKINEEIKQHEERKRMSRQGSPIHFALPIHPHLLGTRLGDMLIDHTNHPSPTVRGRASKILGGDFSQFPLHGRTLEALGDHDANAFNWHNVEHGLKIDDAVRQLLWKHKIRHDDARWMIDPEMASKFKHMGFGLKKFPNSGQIATHLGLPEPEVAKSLLRVSQQAIDNEWKRKRAEALRAPEGALDASTRENFVEKTPEEAQAQTDWLTNRKIDEAKRPELGDFQRYERTGLPIRMSVQPSTTYTLQDLGGDELLQLLQHAPNGVIGDYLEERGFPLEGAIVRKKNSHSNPESRGEEVGTGALHDYGSHRIRLYPHTRMVQAAIHNNQEGIPFAIADFHPDEMHGLVQSLHPEVRQKFMNFLQMHYPQLRPGQRQIRTQIDESPGEMREDLRRVGNPIRMAQVPDNEVHDDFKPTGIAPRVGHLLSRIAAEGRGGASESIESALADGILRTGDTSILPVLADRLDEIQHPAAEAIHWRNVPRSLAIDRALQHAITSIRIRNHNPDSNRHEIRPQTPGWTLADWRSGARNMRLSRRRSLMAVRRVVPDTTVHDLHHSVLRLLANDQGVVDVGSRPVVRDAHNAYLQQLGSPPLPEGEDVTRYPRPTMPQRMSMPSLRERFQSRLRWPIRMEDAPPISTKAPTFTLVHKLSPSRAESIARAIEWLAARLAAHHQEHLRRVNVEHSPVRNGRYEKRSATIGLTPKGGVGEVVHEFGHHLETDPWAKELVDEFDRNRYGKAKPITFASFVQRTRKGVMQLRGYKKTEMGRIDPTGLMEKLYPNKPLDALYVGKVYPDGDTEILSSGLELLHEKPEEFSRIDPEYHALISKILSGDGKPVERIPEWMSPPKLM